MHIFMRLEMPESSHEVHDAIVETDVHCRFLATFLDFLVAHVFSSTQVKQARNYGRARRTNSSHRECACFYSRCITRVKCLSGIADTHGASWYSVDKPSVGLLVASCCLPPWSGWALLLTWSFVMVGSTPVVRSTSNEASCTCASSIVQAVSRAGRHGTGEPTIRHTSGRPRRCAQAHRRAHAAFKIESPSISCWRDAVFWLNMRHNCERTHQH